MSAAIEVFGEATVAGVINKSPSSKAESGDAVSQVLVGYQAPRESDRSDAIKPGKMMRGTSQVLVRLLRDKVIKGLMS